MASFAVILAAAGKSTRFRDKHYKKPFAPLDNRPVWLHSAEKFVNRDDVRQNLVVIAEEDWESFHDKFGANVAILGIEVVRGGKERSDSIANALAKVNEDIDFVVVHDAARPCLANEWIDQLFEAASKHEAVILATPVSSTLKRVENGKFVVETVPRENIWEAQTPQVFRRQLLIDAYAQRGSEPATDDAELVQRTGTKVAIIQGSPINFKITTRDDLKLAAQALKALPKPTILGQTHPFEDDDMWR